MNPLRTLLVDDSKIFLASVTDFLSRDPRIEIVGTAMSGHEAICKAVESRPDIILMDIVMPGGLDGLGATRTIRRLENPPFVVILALLDTAAYRRAALAAGASGYVAKGNFTDSIFTVFEDLCFGLPSGATSSADR